LLSDLSVRPARTGALISVNARLSGPGAYGLTRATRAFPITSYNTNRGE
jgi:hypothetical protein